MSFIDHASSVGSSRRGQKIRASVEICAVAGGQIVKDDDFMPVSQQNDEVRADETAAARDQIMLSPILGSRARTVFRPSFR